MEDIYVQYDEGARECMCPMACEHKMYETTLSVATWPSNQYLVGHPDSPMTCNFEPLLYSQKRL